MISCKSMKRLTLASLDEFETYRDQIIPKLDIACTHSIGRYKSEDVIWYIREGHMQLWLAFEDDSLDGFILTQLIEYPQKKSLRFLCLMGVGVEGWLSFMKTIKDWLPFVKQIEDWSVEKGCSLSQIECPAAWQLYLRDIGYSRGHVLLDKELI